MTRPTASAPHLVWAGGHVLTLFAGTWALKSLLFFWSSAQPSVSYTLAYIGALVSYGIVVYKSAGRPSVSKASLNRVLLDENVQYLVLSAYWLWNRATPIPITLVPFAVFSLFHVLTFVRTTIIPLAFPPPIQGTAAGAAAPSFPKRVQTMIQTWVRTNYDPAMRFVAYVEVVVFVRLLVGAIALQNSLLAPLLFAHFLRFRFVMSSFTRQALLRVDAWLDQKSRDTHVPDPVRKAYLTSRDLISRYASSVLSFDPATSAPAYTPASSSAPAPAPTSTAAPPAASTAAPAPAPTAPSSSIDAAAASAAAVHATAGGGPTL